MNLNQYTCLCIVYYTEINLVPFDNANPPTFAKRPSAPSAKCTKELNITACIVEVEKHLNQGEFALRYYHEDINRKLEFWNLTKVETTVYKKLLILVKNAEAEARKAEIEIEALKPEKFAFKLFLKNEYQKLLKLRNQIWNLRQTNGLLDSDVIEIEKIRQLTRTGLSGARFFVLLVEGKIKDKNIDKFANVTNYAYNQIVVVVKFFKDSFDQEDDFFKKNLTKVEIVVFRALFRLYDRCHGDAQKAMLEFEDVEFVKEEMILILKNGLEKLKKFESDFEELSKTKGLPEEDVRSLTLFLNKYIKKAVKMAEETVKIVERL